jgi:hypothetical protein
MCPPQRGVGRLPPASPIVHLDDLGQQHMIMWTWIARPGRGMREVCDDEPACRSRDGRTTATAAHLAGHLVQIADYP